MPTATWTGVVALLMFAAPLAARAGEATPLGVVELFTSQGCSSCPPADKVLAELAAEGSVVALSYHVDYWDYRGWKDTLGSAENTQRQRDYSRAFSARSVYTPQAVINGRRHVNGASRAKIDESLSAFSRAGKGLTVPISFKRGSKTLTIEAGAAQAGEATSASLVLVFFDTMRQVAISRGENVGQMVTYANPVTAFHSVGLWDGSEKTFELPLAEIDKKGAGGCAVLLQVMEQDGTPGAIIGAAMLQKPSS